MGTALYSLAAGFVFGIGLALSQMIDPAKVINFLDVTGSWDPSLALVMGGALAVTLPAFTWAKRLARPWKAPRFFMPTRTEVDARLIGGAILFGLGWGLVGFCPGPALASLALGEPAAVLFVAAMIAGALAGRWFNDRAAGSPPAARARGT